MGALLAGLALVALIFIGFWLVIKMIIAFYIGCLIYLGVTTAAEAVKDKFRDLNG